MQDDPLKTLVDKVDAATTVKDGLAVIVHDLHDNVIAIIAQAKPQLQAAGAQTVAALEHEINKLYADMRAKVESLAFALMNNVPK